MVSRCRFASSLLALLLLLPLLAVAAPAGKVVQMSGVLMVRKADGTSRSLAADTLLESGDIVISAANSHARIRMTDGAELLIRPNSQLTIEQYRYEPTRPAADAFSASLLKGGLRMITGAIGKRVRESFQLRTVTATIGVRGTDFSVQLCQGDCEDLRTRAGKVPPDGLHSEVHDGTIGVTNAAGTTLLTKGEFGFTPDSTTPVLKVPEADSIRHPATPLLDGQASAGGIGPGCVVQ
jgi:hypothetical protein